MAANPWLTATLEAFEARDAAIKRSKPLNLWELYAIGNAGGSRPRPVNWGLVRETLNMPELPSLSRRDLRSALPTGFRPSYSPIGGGNFSMDPGSYSHTNRRGHGFQWNGGVNHNRTTIWNGSLNVNETVILEGDIDINITHKLDIGASIDLVFDWREPSPDPLLDGGEYRGGHDTFKAAGNAGDYFWAQVQNSERQDSITGDGTYALVAVRNDQLSGGREFADLEHYAMSDSFQVADGQQAWVGIDRSQIDALLSEPGYKAGMDLHLVELTPDVVGGKKWIGSASQDAMSKPDFEQAFNEVFAAQDELSLG